jgi:integrase
MHRKIGRAQQQATPLTRPLLNQLLSTCDDSLRGLRNQVLLRLGYETIRRRSELCAFKFEDIYQAPNGKLAIKLNFSKTDQFGTGKIPLIYRKLFDVLEKWRSMISDEGYILRSINRHGHFGGNLHPASINTILKVLQKELKMDADEQPLSGNSFRVGAALDLLEQGEPLERIMLRGRWQTDSTVMSYLRNWIY